MSNLTAIELIANNSNATTGLFNQRFSTISANFAALNSDLTINFPSGDTLSVFSNIDASGRIHAGQQMGIGATPSAVTTAVFTIAADSSKSDYIHFEDTSGGKSNYLIGSRVGGTADGLNIWDLSGDTMLMSISKQSIRFYQNVVGPVFDVGGALADTYNAATFGTGADSVESRIQAAISQATTDGVSRVYVPANMYPYSAASVSFSTNVQMVREGGDWTVYDVLAYGAFANGTAEDTAAIRAAVQGAVGTNGATVAFSSGTFIIGSTVTIDGPITLQGSGRRATRIRTSSTTQDIFFVRSFEPVSFEHMGIGTSVTRTGGSAIRISGNSSGDSTTAMNRFSRLYNLTISGQSVGIHFEAAYGWTLEGSYVVDNQHTGVRVNNTNNLDAGDATIYACTFDAGATTPQFGIHHVGSSGLRLHNNKILNHGIGYALEHEGTRDLSVLEIIGNSFEAQDTAAIRLSRTGGSGAWSHVIVIGNQFSQSSAFFEIDTSGSWLQFLSLMGNTIILPVAGGTAFRLAGGAHGYIAGNHVTGQGGTSVGIDLGAGTSNIITGVNNYNNLTTKFQDAGTGNGLNQIPQLVVGTSDIGGNSLVRVASSGTHGIASSGNIVAGHTNTVDGRLAAIGGTPSGVYITESLTNITQKIGRIKLSHFTNAEEPLTMLFGFSNSTQNVLRIGGGSSAENVMNVVEVRTASTTTTVTGTPRARWDADGALTLFQHRLKSVRTLAASALTVSAANTNVAADEMVFTVGGASGASLALHSGGTVYGFDSTWSAKAT